VSLHTLGVSGLIGFLIYFSHFYKINIITILAALFVLAGLVASARLKLRAHQLIEVLLGGVIGMVGQFIVYFIYIM
jgi:membrane-associated phospholipid phosphatase